MSHTNKPIIPKYFEEIPNDPLEEGVLYISKKYGIAIHLCACGCEIKAVTPLSVGEWTLHEDGESVSLTPSIGNWSWEREQGYHAHYFITNNEMVFC